LGECDGRLHGRVRLAKNIHRVAKDFDYGSGCTLSTTSPVNFRNFAGFGVDGIGPHIGFVLLDEIQDVMSLPGTGGRGAAPVRTMAAVLLPTGSWEKAHGRGKFHICAVSKPPN
jgi:hypothetical protein